MADRPELAPNAFESLLARLDPDRARAGEKYEQIRRRLIKMLESRGCWNPEELADRTMDRVARKVAGEVEIYSANPYAYFHGVALHILQEFWDEPRGIPLPEDPPEKSRRGDPEMERRMEFLRRCLASLPAADRKAILRYYRGDKRAKIEARKKLAAKLGKSENALRIYIHRIRSRLESCVLSCMKEDVK